MSWRGRLSQSVQELRFLVRKTDDSKGVMEFLQSNYFELRTLNPRLPMAVRSSPADCDEPSMIVARFDYGNEQAVNVTGFTEDQCAAVLEKFVADAGRFPRSAESRCQDLDVVFMYSKEPGVHRWQSPYSYDDTPNQ